MIDQLLVFILLPMLLIMGGVSDLLTMTISNKLCLAMAGLFGVAALWFGLPAEQALMHVAAGFLVLVVCFGLFAAGWIGGGDAKFAAATALWVGFAGLLPYLLMASVFGGLLTVALIYLKAYPIPSLAVRLPFFARLQDRQTGVPYGIALAAAALLVLPDSAFWRAATMA